MNQQAFLLEKLADHMRKLSKEFDPKSHEFSNYIEFFRKLQECFDLGIYNLNYDTVALTACPNAYCGFHNYGDFDSMGVIQRPNWGFLYHIHGSVHHCISSHPYSRIKWENSLHSKFKDRADTGIEMAQGFKPVPLTTFISGGFKLDQLLAEPYQTLYTALVRHVQEADAFLICGYGFGDSHVNRVLQNRFKKPHKSRHDIPKVVILEKTKPDQFRTGRREIHEFWAWELRHTLNATFSDGSIYPSKDDHTVAEFIKQGEFEMDNKERVAIWHDGFHKALSATDKILGYLLN